MRKFGKAIFLIGTMLVVILGACSETPKGSCNINALHKLKDTQLESLNVVTKKAPYPVTSSHAGLKAYYQGGELKGFDRSYPGEHGFIEIRYRVLSEMSYLAEYRESWYALPIDPTQKELKVAQRGGNLFFVCDGKVVKIESLKGLELLKNPDSHLEAKLLRMYFDGYKKAETIK